MQRQPTTRAAAPAGQRPNIVLIMADDMGYSDLGCYGGEIQTPNLDRLAHAGVRFTQFYNTPRCCPTRASLLTGVYPHQAGVGAMNQDLGAPGYEGHLNDRVVTIAEALRTAGYQTGMVGKWHLSNMTVRPDNPDAKALLNRTLVQPIGTPEQVKTWPTHRGFDEFTGTIPGVSNYWDPYGLVHNETPLTPPDLATFFYTDFISERAGDYVERASAQDKPFFLYVAYTAPHWPLHAKESDIAKYRGVYREGWDAIRAARDKRLREAGIIEDRWTLSPRFQNRPANERPAEWSTMLNPPWEIERMATYAAQVDELDQGVGHLLDALRTAGEIDNTLIIFLVDNGACAEVVQASWYDIQTRTRDGRDIHIGNDPKIMPGPQTTWQSYGPLWANASNTPFRKFKHDTNEGGISTPFIMHWPRGIAQQNALVRDVGQLMDIMPTCLEAAGIEYPATFDGRERLPLEGQSLWPMLTGQPVAERGPLFWEHEGARGVRDGKWKLVGAGDNAWELYDMDADRTELHELSAQHPQIVQRLSAEYDAWTKRAGVQPWPIRR